MLVLMAMAVKGVVVVKGGEGGGHFWKYER